jgi:hypothetical protein
MQFNPLNAKLNPICHLLASLEAHHILHVSRISVNIASILLLILPNCHFTRIFHSKILHAPFVSPTQAAWPIRRIFVDLITL